MRGEVLRIVVGEGLWHGEVDVMEFGDGGNAVVNIYGEIKCDKMC